MHRLRISNFCLNKVHEKLVHDLIHVIDPDDGLGTPLLGGTDTPVGADSRYTVDPIIEDDAKRFLERT